METTTITADELQRLKDLQSKINTTILLIGQLTATRIKYNVELNATNTQLDKQTSEYEQLLAASNTLYEELYKKYGDVNIDIESGSILG